MDLNSITSLVQGEHGDLALRFLGYGAGVLGTLWLSFKAISWTITGAKMVAGLAIKSVLGLVAAIPFTAMVVMGAMSGGASILGYGIGELRTGPSTPIETRVAFDSERLASLARDSNATSDKLQTIFAYSQAANQAPTTVVSRDNNVFTAIERPAEFQRMPVGAIEPAGSSRIGWSCTLGGLGMLLCSIIMFVDRVGQDGALLGRRK